MTLAHTDFDSSFRLSQIPWQTLNFDPGHETKSLPDHRLLLTWLNLNSDPSNISSPDPPGYLRNTHYCHKWPWCENRWFPSTCLGALLISHNSSQLRSSSTCPKDGEAPERLVLLLGPDSASELSSWAHSLAMEPNAQDICHNLFFHLKVSGMSRPSFDSQSHCMKI